MRQTTTHPPFIMKQSFASPFILTLWPAIILLLASSFDVANAAEFSTAMDVIRAFPEHFSEVEDFINRTERLQYVFTNPLNGTYFIPVNGILDDLPEDLTALLQLPEGEYHRASMLSNHFIPNDVLYVENITDGLVKPTLLSGFEMNFVRSDADDSITINGGTRATQLIRDFPEVKAENGVIHAITKMLVDPRMETINLFQAAAVQPLYSSFNGLIQLAELVDEYSMNGPFTLFGVPNPVFDAITQDPYAAAAFKNKKYAENFVRNHVMNGLYTPFEIEDGVIIQSQLGTNFKIAHDCGSPDFLDDTPVRNGSFQVSNGIIYVLLGAKLPFSVVDAATSDVQTFGALLQLVDKAGLGSYFQFQPEITVFAPSTTAINERVPAEQLGKYTTPAYKTHLRDILLHHVIEGKVLDEADLAMPMEVVTANGETIKISAAANGQFTINEGDKQGQVTLPGTAVFNPAVVYTTDKFMLPSWANKNIIEVMKERSDVDTILSIADMTELDGVLAQEGPYTLFAVADATLSAIELGNPLLLQTLSSDKAFSKTVLEDHVVDGMYTSDQLIAAAACGGGGLELTTLGGTTISFNATDDGGYTLNGIPVSTTDILAENGVIHMIEGLIGNFPEFSSLPTQQPTGSTASPTGQTASAPTMAPTSSAGMGSLGGSSKMAFVMMMAAAVGMVIGATFGLLSV
mmetsp:Transcript_2136/g.5335  ORF Transcript_2136/g.5335 Transcript_2136/m.5335 type:complete len:689 (+) Transcript_2136:116-2182(+)